MATWDSIDRYMILSSDTHAGAEMRAYKAFLDPRWHEDFDAWADSVTNPWIDLRDADAAAVNWDSDRRLAAMDREGITGEVIFPNTLTPFYDILVHLSGVPRTRVEYERRWAGLRAHNRWLAEFCSHVPDRRRGLVQLLPNDVDDAVAEIEWAAATGVIGGVMVPAVPPNHAVEPWFHPRYDPLWTACASLGMPVHQHQGSGNPDLPGDLPVSLGISFAEHDLWTRRTLLHLVMGGVFERHPALAVVWTEMWGMRWVLEDLARIDHGLRITQQRVAGQPRVLNYSSTFGSPQLDALSLDARGYWARNCYIGASLLPRADVRYRHAVGVGRIMWGDDFPHPEGATGHTVEALRATLFDVPEAECRTMLAGVAAEVYGFPLDALTPVAARIGPRVADVHRPLGPDEVPAVPGEPFREDPPLEALITTGV
jgi:predicted TIM-barrel fold metal-dependent hydrolase